MCLGGREPRDRVAVERARLPGLLVPLAGVAEDLHGHEGASAAELARRRDARLERAVGRDRELDRAREVAAARDLHLVGARALCEQVVGRLAFARGDLAAEDARELALDLAP